MVAVLAPVAGVALGSAIGDVNQCRETVALDVAAAPEIAPVLTEHAADWSAAAKPSQGTCVTVSVTAVDSASMAVAYAEAGGTELDVGDAEIEPVELPDVWVPESLIWAVRLGDGLDELLSDRMDPVAASPLGFGIDQNQTEGVFEGMLLQDATVAVNDPRSDVASLALLLTAQEHGVDLKTDSSGAVPMSAAAVTAHNRAADGTQLAFVSPQPTIASFEYPYIAWSNQDSALKRGVEVFRSSLLTNGFTDRLTEHNLQIAGPYPSMPDAEAVAAAVDDWTG